MKGKSMDAFLQIAPLFKDMLQEDIAVVVADQTTVLYYKPGDTVKLKINVGSELSVDDPLYKAIRDDKTYSSIVPKEVYGVPFKAITLPIKGFRGNVVGGISICKSLTQQFKVEESTETLFSSLEETGTSIEEISGGSEKLLNIIDNIVEITKQTEKHIKESNEIINMIQNIASQSNLLGLNAAIEAARSGEQGRGFTVVASEMRKLAQLSSESSQKVSKVLSETSKSMEEIFRMINQAQIISKGQATATEGITATLEEITASAQIMAGIAKVK